MTREALKKLNESGKSRLQGNCAGTHRHRGRNDNRRHCSTERSIKAV